MYDAFTHMQQAVGLSLIYKPYETTEQYGIIQNLYKAGSRGRLPMFIVEHLKHWRFANAIAGLILGLHQANEKCHYNVTPSLIGFAQA